MAVLFNLSHRGCKAWAHPMYTGNSSPVHTFALSRGEPCVDLSFDDPSAPVLVASFLHNSLIPEEVHVLHLYDSTQLQ